MRKINWKKENIVKLLYCSIVILLIVLLIYTRFVNLGWGLPYPMHPDERNVATALQSLGCCGNPHFFAYGQLPLFLGLGVLGILGKLGKEIAFTDAVMSLRIISAAASVLAALVMMGILKGLEALKEKKYVFFTWLVIIFSPALIQFSHFGTTESLLMLFYLLIIYYSILFIQEKIPVSRFLLLSSLTSGLAMATKVSAGIFLIVPIFTFILKLKYQNSKPLASLKLRRIGGFIFLSALFFIFFSPLNLISLPDFLGSMKYEADVATGRYVVFYTRQFVGSIPIVFQALKVFPYALGWPVFGLAILGGIRVLRNMRKKREFQIVFFAFFVYFLPNAFLFAKWVRFMAPVMPILIIFAITAISNIKCQMSKLSVKFKSLRFKLGFDLCVLIFAILPGISYLSVYQNPDVRFQASKWIYKNIPSNSYILSETANVVDIPIPISKLPNCKIISFNFYDLDESKQLQEELKEHLQKADYIFVPSRRIFANLNSQHPLLKEYYRKLFNGELGFRQVAEFSNPWLRDEQAEETWTVFDHPVIRIFKKVKG